MFTEEQIRHANDEENYKIMEESIKETLIDNTIKFLNKAIITKDRCYILKAIDFIEEHYPEKYSKNIISMLKELYNKEDYIEEAKKLIERLTY